MIMAEIICCGSSSEGNAYILKCDNEALLVELGVPFREIRRALNNDISMVKAALVTHVHSDHAKYIPQAQEYGLPVFSCKEVVDKYAGVTELKLGEAVMLGGFKVQPMEVPHSCQCYAYLIQNEEIGKLLFVTDCVRFNYKIKGINHVLCEANWCEEILINNLCNDVETRSHHEHHMELSDTIKALKSNYSPDLMTVGLLHLSNGNSDEKMFRQRVIDELGFDNVVVMDKSVSIPLQLSEF